MSRRMPSPPSPSRRNSHPAVVCFVVSTIAFIACGMGLLVNHMLTGSLAVSGTAAIGLIYLAMGLMNLGIEVEEEGFEVVVMPAGSTDDDADHGADPDGVDPHSRAASIPSCVSSTRKAALSSHD